MKLVHLVRHMEENGCRQLREGRSHTIWENPANLSLTAMARHTEIPPSTARKICKDLGIPKPRSVN